MKNIYMKLGVVLFILCLGTFSVAAELQDGFMGYKWGDNISNYAGLNRLYEKKDITYYSNPDESYTIDDIAIGNVVFGFYQNKLFGVYIGIDTLEKYDSIKQYMRSKYGFPGTKVSSKEYLTTLKWKYQDVTIKLKTDDIGGKMKIAFYYMPLSRDLKKEQFDGFSESTFKFFPIDKNKQPDMIPFLEF